MENKENVKKKVDARFSMRYFLENFDVESSINPTNQTVNVRTNPKKIQRSPKKSHDPRNC